MGVSYHIAVGIVTHSQIPFTPDKQLAGFNRIDRARCGRQGHSFEDRRTVTHDRDTTHLQAETASFLWRAEETGILAAVALRVLLHLALGPAEDADLERLLIRDEAAIVAATTHNRRRSGGRHRSGKRRRSGTVVILGLAGGDVAAVDGRVGVAAVRVQIARELGGGRQGRQ